MGVTTRHTRRILAAYRERGAAAVAHGHRGRRPANATPDAVVAGVVRLARTRYEGANHTHLSELLSEREGIDIGRTTLRRILVNADLSSPRRRRPPKHRVRRQRMPREGMLIQMDGTTVHTCPSGQPETATRGAPPDWGGRVRRLPLPPADGTPSALLRPAPFRGHSNRLPGTRTACERNGSVRTLVPCCRRAGWGPMSAPGSWRCRPATPVPCPTSMGGRWTAGTRWCTPPSAAVRAATSPAPSSRAPCGTPVRQRIF